MRSVPEFIELSIQKLSPKGYGIGVLPQGKEIEVAHSVPGDHVRVEWRKKKGAQKGRLLDILVPSSERVQPKCPHVGVCGGCSWQQMDYKAQLQEKERRVDAAFGGLYPISAIIPCEDPYGYRNKMEFSFSQNRGGMRYLGLMIAQAEPYVFNVTECHLGPSWFASAVAAVRAWWEGGALNAYYPPQDTGTLRYLTLREAFRTGQKMAVLNVSGNPEFAPSRADLDAFVVALRTIVDPISLFLRVHQTKKGRPTQFYEMHLYGDDHLVEEMHLAGEKLSFKVSPISFFQPNPLQAEKLYDAALQMLTVGHTCRPKLVYDLYCGTGTLSMAAAKYADRVVGIELSPEAVLDAEENLKRNRIGNVSFYQGDVGEVTARLRQSPGFSPPDAVIVDPPRAGLDPQALQSLKMILPKTIVYISCNPLTQAQNIAELVEAGYRLTSLQPIDQFPHTYHIETIACLVR